MLSSPSGTPIARESDPESLFQTLSEVVQASQLQHQGRQSRGRVPSTKNMIVPVLKDSVTKTIVQEVACQLTVISHSVKKYRSEINKLASNLSEYKGIMKMYGIGKSTYPQIKAEIGDVTRFKRKQSLVVFAFMLIRRPKNFEVKQMPSLQI